MIITRVLIVLGILYFAGIYVATFAEEIHSVDTDMQHHNVIGHMNDERISLGLSPQMKRHQLSNMRSHVAAIQTIVGLIGAGDFDAASEIAHTKLGLTEDMRRMCNMFENKDFTRLGLEFHKSADTLGDVLKTEDVNKSLRALQITMGYCVQCHATFRQ